MPKQEIHTQVDGRKLKLTNPTKILYPKAVVAKAEVVQYSLSVADVMLKHIKGRPLTLIRYPEGISGTKFYSKNKPDWTPSWIASTDVADDHDNHYVLANERATLVWVANLAGLEIHPMNVRNPDLLRPDQFIFDLDPSEAIDFEQLKYIAKQLKEHLETYGYKTYIKTSGSKGLHIYIPVKPVYHRDKVYEVLEGVAKSFVKKHPKTTTLSISMDKRKGRVLLDILRNKSYNSCVAPYSLRAREGAPVSMPFRWDELDAVNSSRQWDIRSSLEYLNINGDAWTDIWDQATELHTSKTIIPNPQVSKRMIRPKPSIPDPIVFPIAPMLASAGKSIPISKDYFYEIKWDGIRAIFVKQGTSFKIYSRNGNDITDKFPNLQSIKDCVNADTAVLDGEIVHLDTKGRPDFAKIVGRIHVVGEKSIAIAAKRTKATAYLFDLLYLDGKDCTNETNLQRREWLEAILTVTDICKFSVAFEDGEALLNAIKAQNMEGIICKDKRGQYTYGKRTDAWQKIKVRHDDEAYIIGFTRGEGERTNGIGALHLAKKIDSTQWQYMGKVGTGYDAAMLADIQVKLEALPLSDKLVTDSIEKESRTVWITPSYICELSYASLSSNGTYREPVYKRMRLHKG